MNEFEDLDDIIKHFGVKGMKWGVRKDPNKSSNKKMDKADKKWSRKAMSSGTYGKVYNAAMNEINQVGVHKLNNSPKYKGKDLKKDTKLQDAYLKDYARMTKETFNRHSDKLVGTSATGRLKLEFNYDVDYGSLPTRAVISTEIKHSNTGVELVIKLNYSETGHIISMEIEDPLLKHSNNLGNPLIDDYTSIIVTKDLVRAGMDYLSRR